ncbi:MAG TPA: Na(+)/H(+) antiporter subunit C [Acidimicrobiia bacterium]|nr:Na(+)/H(+) antiporter subunit C [Acidimicrobiia bacterium]
MSFAPGSMFVLVIGVLAAAGVYLLLERSLSRVAIGMILLGNAVNLLFLVVGGPPGGAPIVGQTPASEMADPLPQAMILTAIVITLALTGFLLAMAYRSWQINQHDEVQDDLEDRRIARLAAIGPSSGDQGVEVPTLDEEAAEARDETELFVEEHWLAGDQDDL